MDENDNRRKIQAQTFNRNKLMKENQRKSLTMGEHQQHKYGTIEKQTKHSTRKKKWKNVHISTKTTRQTRDECSKVTKNNI